MKLNKNQKIIGIVLLTILSIFLIIKYNCEKLHQDILMYGDKDVSAVYLVNSKIRKDNLYLDIIGPISKGNVFVDSDINIEIKDNSGTTIGKYLVKDSEIFNTRGKHITFSAMIPNITLKDRLAGFKIDMILSRKYTDKYCINNDMSNIKLYYKGDKSTKDIQNTSKLNLYQMFFTKSWVKSSLEHMGLDYEELITAFKIAKQSEIKDRVSLIDALTEQGYGRYAEYMKYDAYNNVKVYVNNIPVEITENEIKNKIDIWCGVNSIWHWLWQPSNQSSDIPKIISPEEEKRAKGI